MIESTGADDRREASLSGAAMTLCSSSVRVGSKLSTPFRIHSPAFYIQHDIACKDISKWTSFQPKTLPITMVSAGTTARRPAWWPAGNAACREPVGKNQAKNRWIKIAE
jgi:hypothetical protein